MHLKKFLLLAFIFFSYILKAFSYAEIKAENNAYRHNNKGLIYLQENYYFGAIREFQIAINLMPNAQASAAYYVNLAMTYEKIGYPSLALPNYEKALSLYPLYFDYYKRASECYKKLNIVDKKLNEYLNKKYNPLNDIMIGLLYIQKGDIKIGVMILDEFCNKEKELLITQGVREYIDQIAKENVRA